MNEFQASFSSTKIKMISGPLRSCKNLRYFGPEFPPRSGKVNADVVDLDSGKIPACKWSNDLMSSGLQPGGHKESFNPRGTLFTLRCPGNDQTSCDRPANTEKSVRRINFSASAFLSPGAVHWLDTAAPCLHSPRRCYRVEYWNSRGRPVISSVTPSEVRNAKMKSLLRPTAHLFEALFHLMILIHSEGLDLMKEEVSILQCLDECTLQKCEGLFFSLFLCF